SAKPQPNITQQELMLAFAAVMQRIKVTASHSIQRESLSVGECMSRILERLKTVDHLEFTGIFTPEEGKKGLIASFLALLELIKDHLVEMVQTAPFAPIYLKHRRK